MTDENIITPSQESQLSNPEHVLTPNNQPQNNNEPQSKNLNPDSYYTDKNKKIIDFLIGFFGIWVINSITGIISLMISGAITMISIVIAKTQPIANIIPVITSFFLLIAQIGIYIYIIRQAFKRDRRFIAIGILSSLVIPLLLFGACFAIFSTF